MPIRREHIIPKVSEDERSQPSNEVVYYINGKAIVQDDYGELFYFECPEENVVLGETIDQMILSPFSSLPEKEKTVIEQDLKELIEIDNEE